MFDRQDAGTEEYLRPPELIGLDKIYMELLKLYFRFYALVDGHGKY